MHPIRVGFDDCFLRDALDAAWTDFSKMIDGLLRRHDGVGPLSIRRRTLMTVSHEVASKHRSCATFATGAVNEEWRRCWVACEPHEDVDLLQRWRSKVSDRKEGILNFAVGEPGGRKAILFGESDDVSNSQRSQSVDVLLRFWNGGSGEGEGNDPALRLYSC